MDMRKKSILRRLIPWIIALAALAALVFFVFVPMYSQTEKTFGRDAEVFFYDGDGKALTMENDWLKFEMDTSTTQFTVTNKNTGKVWYSNPVGREKDPIAKGINADLLSSTLTLSYYDAQSLNEINNFTSAIQNQSYRILPQEDGSIRVDYAVGKIERVFLIPSAITKERYTEFAGKMSKKSKKKLGNYYSLYEPSKLNKKSNKDEIIAMFPSVTEQPLYILQDIDAKRKEDIEGFFQEAGYTAEDYELDMQLMVGERSTSGPVFNVSVIYRLDGNDLVVEMPYSEVRCSSDYPIVNIGILPLFGAGGTADTGYMLVPEGSGALINFNNGKRSQNAYYANLFGWDYGTKRTEVVNETEAPFGVFGISYEDGAFICIMEDGNSYGAVSADIAGRVHSYNLVYPKYSVLHYDNYKVTGRTAKLLLMYEQEIPSDTVVQRYRILDESGYVAMGKAYGEYLRAKPEMKAESASADLPVNVELVGAIDKMVAKYGVPMDTVVPATTFTEASGIMNDLLDAGVRDLNLRYTGWSNGGVNQKVLTSVHTLGELGGDGALKKLIAEAKEKGVDLYLDGISCFAYDSGILEGFIPYEHAGRFTTREIIKMYAYDIVTYRESTWTENPFYLLRPGYAKQYAGNLIKALADRQAAGVAFRDIGNLLSGDYYDHDTVTREQVKAMNIETLQDADKAGLKVSVKEGNEYALPYADLVTDMNLTGSAYGILDETVPFYQIAIHGLKDYTCEAINLAGDYKTLLLECAEYGAGLNFTVMSTDTSILQDSAYSCYTSAGYQPWKDEIIATILKYQNDMKGLNRQRIDSHEILADGVAATVYEDGTRVYVNYTDVDYTSGAVTVPAREYVVERGNRQ